MTRTFTAACFVLLVATAAVAQQPQAASPTTRLIPYAAMLPDAGPDAIAGARTVTFALFDDVEGGTLLWSETQIVMVDLRGRYTTHLGVVMALPLEIFRTEQARWLEVSIDGQALPRTMLVAVPYALRAADAETLGGKPLSEFVLSGGNGRRGRADGTMVDGPAVEGTGVANQLAKWADASTLSSSVVAESFDNRIGIFAPDPTGGGVVDSRFTIRHLDNNTAIGVLNTSNQRRFALNTLATGGFQFFDGGSGTWNPGLTQRDGNIGLGTTSPDAKLKVVQAVSTDAIVASAAVSGRHAFRGVSPTGSIAILGVISNNPDFNLFFNAAVYGHNELGGAGVVGFSSSGTASFSGVAGFSNTGTAVYGSSTSGLAGHFNGNVTVSGTLSKGGGAFQIDHPLDLANKYLRHSFVESPDMMNVYNGNTMLDANGEAWVTLPEWFDALNRDFRYQLTSIGAPGPNLHIASKISGNRFRIAGGAAGAEVSWQVTGIRQDAWANAHRIVVEEDKPEKERGFYLHPDAVALPADRQLPLGGGVIKR